MFKIVKSDIDTVQPTEYLLMTDTEAVAFGEALVMTAGRLTLAAPTETPEFISIVTQAAETTSVTKIPVVRVRESQLYEVKSSATVAATLIGSKVTLGAYGLTVTATTTGGVFYIDETDGVTTTSKVRGRFKKFADA